MPSDFGGCCISVHERKSHIIAGSTGATRLRIPVGNNVTSVLSIVLHVVPRKTDTPLWPRKSQNIVPSPFLSSPPPSDHSPASYDLDSAAAEECWNRDVSCEERSLTIRRQSWSRNEDRAKTRKIKIKFRARYCANESYVIPSSVHFIISEIRMNVQQMLGTSFFVIY